MPGQFVYFLNPLTESQFLKNMNFSLKSVTYYVEYITALTNNGI